MNKKNFVKLITLTFLSALIFTITVDIYAQKRPKKKARNLARVAGKLYNQGRYAESIVKYAEALSISPHFPQARFFKGSAHYKQKQYDLALSELDLALQQGTEPAKVYAIRMEVYADKEDYSAARDDAEKVLNLNPENSYYQAFLGKTYLGINDFQKAKELFLKALELGSRNANIHYYLAEVYNQTGEYDKQGESADKALKSGSTFTGNSWYLLADSQKRNRKYLDAERSYKNAVNFFVNEIETKGKTPKTESNLYQSYVELADIYRNLNRFDEAIKTAKQGLSLRTSDGPLHISLTWYYSLAGRRDDALVAGKKAIELAPNDYMAHTNYCRAFNDQGEFLHSRQAFRMAQREFNNAINQCKRALTIEPNDGETNYYLGRAYFFLDNNELSDRYYRKSVGGLIRFTENNPDYSDGFYLLGNAYFATGQNAEAIKAYEKCLSITPRFARVRYNLGYVYFQEGNETAAREQHDMLQKLDAKLAKRLMSVIEGD